MNKSVVAQAATSELSSEATAKSWHIASRWQEFEGEMRSAVLRALLVVVFYAIQLVHYLTLQVVAEPDRVFHRQVTMAAIGWLFLSISILIALRGGFMPPILKYISTAIDLSLVTMLAWLSHGPSSPLVLVLFLVLAIAALRFRIGLIWFATIGAMASYLLLVGSEDTSWFDANHTTPLLTQAITLCSIASTGIVLGQIVRTPKRMADAFLSRVGQDRKGETA